MLGTGTALEFQLAAHRLPNVLPTFSMHSLHQFLNGWTEVYDHYGTGQIPNRPLVFVEMAKTHCLQLFFGAFICVENLRICSKASCAALERKSFQPICKLWQNRRVRFPPERATWRVHDTYPENR